MDHAIGDAPAAAREPQPRPGWWWTIGGVLLAWVMMTVGMVGAALVLSVLKVDVSLVLLRGWAWAPDGVWAIAAGVGPALLAAVLFGLSLRFLTEWRSDFKLLLWPATLPVLALLLLESQGTPDDSGARATVALLVTVVIARQFAIVPARNPWRPQRWLVVLIGIAVLALTAATLAYRPFHPLHVQLGDEPRGGNITYGFADDANPRVLGFGFDNASFADARIVTATAIASGAPVVVQFANPEPHAIQDGWISLPAGGIDLAPGASDPSGVIRLAPGTCLRPGGHPAEVHGLELQVETLGMARTQRFMRDAPVTLHCPAHRPG